jgi:beta-glucuronidase
VRFLDLCDELGICVWNEGTAWQPYVDHLQDPHFLDAMKLNLREMVASSINRPSVILWGICNEGHSHKTESRPAYAELLEMLRDLDGTRPVTYACNHPLDDECLDLVDVVAINTYPSWYGPEGDLQAIGKRLDQVVRHLDKTVSPEIPMILSEIGAGAIYGWRDWNERRWTEQYQAALLETVIEHIFVKRDRWCGLSIWQFGDGRTEENKAIGRPRQFNNKGVLDEYRRPKMAYQAVRQLFAELGTRPRRRPKPKRTRKHGHGRK